MAFEVSYTDFDEMQEITLDRISRRKKFQWNDLLAHDSFLPQHKRRVQRIIARVMGYVPSKFVYFPHQAFMRSEYDRFMKGQTSEQHFWTETLLHVIDIRNDDMVKNGYIDYREFGSLQQMMYEGFMPERIDTVRRRICSVLGYEPDLAYSFEAEMWLREAMSNLGMTEKSPITAQDYRAITITKFREILINEGYKEASCSYFSCERPDIDVFKDDDGIYESDEMI